MKAKKLERIRERYPWLEQELSGPIAGQKPNPKRLEFVAIKEIDQEARAEFVQTKSMVVASFTSTWRYVRWVVLFRIGNEETLRGRYVADANDESRPNEHTVDGLIQRIDAWYNGCLKDKETLEFVAVIKRVFRGMGSAVEPTKVTVYLFVKTLTVGKVYRLKPVQLGGYNYALDYADGNYIHVRILAGPYNDDRYRATTRDEDGRHLGPAGGWTGVSELIVTPAMIEEIS